MIMISSNFIFNVINFCVLVSFLTKLLTLGLLISKALRTVVVVAKLVILGILFLTSFILTLRAAVVAQLVLSGIFFLASFVLALQVVLTAKVVISGILSSIFLTLELYASLLTTLFFNESLSFT